MLEHETRLLTQKTVLKFQIHKFISNDDYLDTKKINIDCVKNTYAFSENSWIILEIFKTHFVVGSGSSEKLKKMVTNVFISTTSEQNIKTKKSRYLTMSL